MVRTLYILILLVALCGCKRDQWDDCITSTGPMRSEVRELGQFHEIDLDDRIDLIFEERPSGTVQVEAGRNLLHQVRTEISDGILMIRNGNRCNWVRSFKPRITVRVPLHDAHTLTIRGAGNITCTDTIERPVFRLEQWGAMGTADLILEVDALFIGLHTGAGDIVLKGRAAHFANYYSDMMGVIDATEFRSPVVNVNNSGLGDFRCWAFQEMNVQIKDVGNVYYRGDPVINSEITGTGSLIRMEY